MRRSLPSHFPDGVVFIIDGLMAAYIVASMCAGRSIRCIYECKEVEWRNVDFVALYDLLLSDVKIQERRIETVPHPYFLQSKSLMETIRSQRLFIQSVLERVTLDRDTIYCGCVTSSILLANKGNVSHILIDEGMDSLMTRHRLYSMGRPKWKDRIRGLLAGWLIPFRFDQNTPQITLARDEHRAIVLRNDYRNFRSHRFSQLTKPLLKHLGRSEKNVLTLVNGPPHLSATPVSNNSEDFDGYIEFNLQAIKRFISLHPSYKTACFYLKAHPSLGKNHMIIESLLDALTNSSINAVNICEGISFEELPSIPAEAYLTLGKFKTLLSLDISSTLWHVGHDSSLMCFMPLDDIIGMASKNSLSKLVPLLMAQRELNRINGNNIIFY